MGVKAPLLFLSLLLANNSWSAYLSDKNTDLVEISAVVEAVNNNKKAPYVAAYEVFNDLFIKKKK